MTHLPRESIMPPFTKKQQIIEDLTEKIRSGELPPHAQLPTSPKLCEQYRTSLVTVRAAIAILKAQGYVETVHGAGVFVVDRPPS